MQRPDFARSDLYPLPEGDLRFLVENMPTPGHSYEEIARVLDRLPTTLESMLNSDFVFHAILDSRRLILDISPFLLFNVLLRQSLGKPRDRSERRVVHYLANLLALFVRADRLVRIEPGDAEPRRYLVELMQEAAGADPRRAFLAYAHIGNYALWLTGLHLAWLEHRYHHGRRPVSPAYYAETGQSSFDRAARHRLAREFDLTDIFLRLALRFDHYQRGLNQLHRQFM